MTVVLDAGALIAIERGNREMIAIIERERLNGRSAITCGGIVGQVWRGGRHRQARLAQVLRGLEISPIDRLLGARAGELLREAHQSDVIDSALVCISRDGDEIYTSDASDLKALSRAAGSHVELIAI
jgi:hypothetical protein